MGNALIVSLYMLYLQRLTLCGKCAFPQNFCNKKLDEVTVFYIMEIETRTFCFDSHKTYLSFFLSKTLSQ